MNFPDTVPGDRIHAESAARYNAVNALLRTACTGNSPAGNPEHRTVLTVDIRNGSDTVIEPYTAVTFTGNITPQCDDAPHLPGFTVTIAVNAELPWGIATGAIAPGEWGTAVVCGATPAHFVRYDSGGYASFAAGTQVIPSADGLIPGDRNSAAVLSPAWTHNGIEYPGIILLSAVATPFYADQFAASWESFTGMTLKIAAGTTDFPGVASIPGTVISAVGSSPGDRIYLVITYQTDSSTGNASYSAEYCISSDDPENSGDCFAFEIAAIRKNFQLVQSWKHGKIVMPGWVL